MDLKRYKKTHKSSVHTGRLLQQTCLHRRKEAREAKKMNSSAPFHKELTPSECDFYIILGGRLDQSTTEVYAVLLFMAIMAIITCPITTVLNALAMFVVGTKPRLQTESNVVFACLATTDGIMGAIGHPLFIVQITSILQKEEEASSENCLVIQFSKYNLAVLGTASLFHLTLMNLERYIAIKQSHAYVNVVTKSRILCSSALAWIVSLLLAVPLPIIDNSIYLAVSNISTSLCIAVIVYCQVVLYFEIRRHEKQIAAQQVSMEAKQKFLKDKKVFRLTTTVVVILLLTYAPLVVQGVRILIVKSALNLNVTYIAFFTAVFMAVFNSLINPIIYCVRIREFRVAFIEILCKESNAQAEEIEMEVFGSLNTRETRQHEKGQQREEGQHNEQDNSQNTGSNNENNSDNNDSDNNYNSNNNNNSNNSNNDSVNNNYSNNLTILNSNNSNNDSDNNNSEDSNNHSDDDDGDRGSTNSKDSSNDSDDTNNDNSYENNNDDNSNNNNNCNNNNTDYRNANNDDVNNNDNNNSSNSHNDNDNDVNGNYEDSYINFVNEIL